MDEIYENYEIDFTVRDLQKLANNEPELIIKHSKKLVINFELTITEVEELEEKLHINLSNIIELDLSLQLRNLGIASNSQLYLIFDDK